MAVVGGTFQAGHLAARRSVTTETASLQHCRSTSFFGQALSRPLTSQKWHWGFRSRLHVRAKKGLSNQERLKRQRAARELKHEKLDRLAAAQPPPPALGEAEHARLAKLAEDMVRARSLLLEEVPTLMQMVPVKQCRWCPELYVGPEGHSVRDCKGFAMNLRNSRHEWRDAAREDVYFEREAYHLYDRDAPQPTHVLRNQWFKVPALLELCLQAGATNVRLPQPSTPSLTDHPFSIPPDLLARLEKALGPKKGPEIAESDSEEVSDSDDEEEESEEASEDPPEEPRKVSGLQALPPEMLPAVARWLGVSVEELLQENSAASAHQNSDDSRQSADISKARDDDVSTDQSADVSRAQAVADAWACIVEGIPELLEWYSAWGCKACDEVHVGPRGHKIRTCGGKNHTHWHGIHQWREPTLEDLFPQREVFHLNDSEEPPPIHEEVFPPKIWKKEGRPPEAKYLRTFVKFPAIAELAVQAGAKAPDWLEGTAYGTNIYRALADPWREEPQEDSELEEEDEELLEGSELEEEEGEPLEGSSERDYHEADEEPLDGSDYDREHLEVHLNSVWKEEPLEDSGPLERQPGLPAPLLGQEPLEVLTAAAVTRLRELEEQRPLSREPLEVPSDRPLGVKLTRGRKKALAEQRLIEKLFPLERRLGYPLPRKSKLQVKALDVPEGSGRENGKLGGYADQSRRWRRDSPDNDLREEEKPVHGPVREAWRDQVPLQQQPDRQKRVKRDDVDFEDVSESSTSRRQPRDFVPGDRYASRSSRGQGVWERGNPRSSSAWDDTNFDARWAEVYGNEGVERPTNDSHVRDRHSRPPWEEGEGQRSTGTSSRRFKEGFEDVRRPMVGVGSRDTRAHKHARHNTGFDPRGGTEVVVSRTYKHRLPSNNGTEPQQVNRSNREQASENAPAWLREDWEAELINHNKS